MTLGSLPARSDIDHCIRCSLLATPMRQEGVASLCRTGHCRTHGSLMSIDSLPIIGKP